MANIIKRQQMILQLLHEQAFVSTQALSEYLQVSPLTVRRDLQTFEKKGIVKCIHGGANLISNGLQNDPSQTIDTEATRINKEKIARHAASFVEDGDMIFINSGSTAMLMLSYIAKKHVIVVTNNCQALNLNIDPQIELILTGGNVYQNKKSLVGEMALNNLSRVAVNKVFLGVSGISSKDGLTTSVLQETPINELMAQRPGVKCIVVADGSKIGSRNNFKYGSLQSVSMLITDETADTGELFELRDLGIEVFQVQA